MTTQSPLSVATALAEAAESIDESRTVQETLDAIVAATQISVPEFPHVSVSVRHSDGTIETKAGTDRLVWELDAVQYGLNEGPCVQAIQEEPLVLAEDLRREQRWPRYVPEAIAHGVRSQMAVRLFASGRHIGGLNFYSRACHPADENSAETARLFATHAAIMLGHAQHEDNLNAALQSRKVIGQAIGIVMERFHIDQDQAFHYLVRVSTTSNIKLRDVAEELVVSSTERYRSMG